MYECINGKVEHLCDVRLQPGTLRGVRLGDNEFLTSHGAQTHEACVLMSFK